MEKMIIIDGNAIIHRAYHALPPMTTKKGQMVNAVYGFASMLLKAWKDIQPQYIAVTFDLAGPTFRHEKYTDYKATRVKADQELYDQIPLVHELVKAFNIPIFTKQGFEADDIIGSIVELVIPKNKKIKNKQLEIYVITGDLDALQLVRPQVKIYTLRKGMSDIIIYDEKQVKEKYGFSADFLVDYKALRGDASDNIPGVLGIGEKTATELIKRFSTISSLYKKLDKQEVVKELKPVVINKLKQGKEKAFLSYELAMIDTKIKNLNFDLKKCQVKNLSNDKIIALMRELEFFSLIRRLENNNLVSEVSKKQLNGQNKDKNPLTKILEIKTKNEVKELLDLIIKNKEYVLKIIFSDKDVFKTKIETLAIFTGTTGAIIPVEFFEFFNQIFSKPNIKLVVYDIKKIAKFLIKENIILKNDIFDLMLASYLLNPGTRTNDEANLLLRYSSEKNVQLLSGQNSLFGVDKKQLIEELRIFLNISKILENELSKVNNLDLLKKIEIPLSLILAKMELNGIKIDLLILKKLAKTINKEIEELTDKIYNLAGEEFNIASPLQLREILFEKIAIPVLGIKKGKTGLSTAQTELEKMRGLHPIIEKIERWRELTKLKNTYVDVLPTLVNEKTGRLHTTFNQAITATGRLSSSEPNLQNIPIRGELGQLIRKTFIAETGSVLIGVDYSQIELRIVASLAEDKKMIEIFNKNKDVHQATAAIINNIPLDKVTKEMRRAAKEVNFGVLYGMGAYGLSDRTDLTQKEAKKFIEKYFTEFKQVKKYLETTISFTKETGYCETLFGRRRYIPEIESTNYQIRSAAERMAINHPVQGTAADLMKMAMIEINNKLIKENLINEVKLLLQVHDEILIETKKDLAEKVAKLIKEVMENVVILRVPVSVEVNIADNWGEMK